MFDRVRKLGAGLPSAALTLAAAAAGGALFAVLGLPVPWLSGPLVAVAGLALAGVAVSVPSWPVRIAFIVLGVSMGVGITPETLHLMATWPVSMAALLLSIPIATLATGVYLHRCAGFDRPTAFFAAVPGALSYVMVLSLQHGADVPRVAFVQVTRLFLLSVGLPLVLAAAGELGAPVPAVPAGSPVEIVVMLAAGAIVALLFERWNVPGGPILGAMLASALLHGTGLVTAAVPPLLLLPCFVVLGAMIGARFAGTTGATVRALAGVALVAFVISVTIAAAFALAAALLVDGQVGQLVLAFAPGGLEAMVILGFALGFDPAFVAAHHLARFVSLALSLPVVLKRLLRP